MNHDPVLRTTDNSRTRRGSDAAPVTRGGVWRLRATPDRRPLIGLLCFLIEVEEMVGPG
jgi:hypothetical protein